MVERSGGYFSGMKVLVDFFAKEAPNIANSKMLTKKEIPVVTRYTRQAYLAVSVLISCDRSIYRNFVKDMVNNYDMGQDR